MGNSKSKEKVVCALQSTIHNLVADIRAIPDYNYVKYDFILDTVHHFDPLNNCDPHFAAFKLKMNGIRLALPGAQKYMWKKYHIGIQRRIAIDLPKIEKIASDNDDTHLLTCLQKFRETCDHSELVDWSLSQD